MVDSRQQSTISAVLELKPYAGFQSGFLCSGVMNILQCDWRFAIAKPPYPIINTHRLNPVGSGNGLKDRIRVD